MSFITEYNVNTFARTNTLFSKPIGLPSASGQTTQMGGAFILLSAQILRDDYTDTCRLRLYSDSSSRATDLNRAVTDYNISESVALIADINLTGSSVLTFDPPIIGNTFSNGEVFWHISGSTIVDLSDSIAVVSYPIATSNNSQIDRSGLLVTASNVPTTGNGVSGSIISPKSFLILSGSATSQSRLRLYSRPHTEVPAYERTRPFTSQSQSGSLLIADLMFDSASFRYPLVPVLEAYTWTSTDYSVGNNQIGYILENRSAGTANITASLYIYTTED